MQGWIAAENTFPIWYVEAWASRGVCPPPLLGSSDSATSAFFSMSMQDQWDWEAPLRVSDEEGVKIQLAHRETQIRRELDLTVRVPGTDDLLFHWAQEAMKRLGRWHDPPTDHEGSFWSESRPMFWVWGAEPAERTRPIFEMQNGADAPPIGPVTRLRQAMCLREDAERYDRWLLRQLDECAR